MPSPPVRRGSGFRVDAQAERTTVASTPRPCKLRPCASASSPMSPAAGSQSATPRAASPRSPLQIGSAGATSSQSCPMAPDATTCASLPCRPTSSTISSVVTPPRGTAHSPAKAASPHLHVHPMGATDVHSGGNRPPVCTRDVNCRSPTTPTVNFPTQPSPRSRRPPGGSWPTPTRAQPGLSPAQQQLATRLASDTAQRASPAAAASVFEAVFDAASRRFSDVRLDSDNSTQLVFHPQTIGGAHANAQPRTRPSKGGGGCDPHGLPPSPENGHQGGGPRQLSTPVRLPRRLLGDSPPARRHGGLDSPQSETGPTDLPSSPEISRTRAAAKERVRARAAAEDRAAADRAVARCSAAWREADSISNVDLGLSSRCGQQRASRPTPGASVSVRVSTPRGATASGQPEAPASGASDVSYPVYRDSCWSLL